MKYKNFILCQNLNKIVQIIWSTLLFLIFLDHSSTFEAFCDPSSLPNLSNEKNINSIQKTEQPVDLTYEEAFWQSSFGQFIEKYPAPEILLVLSVGGLLYLYFFIK